MRSHIETSESQTQVFINPDGVLEVHDNVVFKANYGLSGGAVSLTSGIDFDLPVVVLCHTLCQGWF